MASLFSPAGIKCVPPRTVVLTSSLSDRFVAYPEEIVTFTCITMGSSILAWESRDYIGDGIQLEFISIDSPGLTQQSGTTTFATLDSVTNDNGEIVLVSTLQITASSQFPTSSVACRHVDSGTLNSTTFNVASEQYIYNRIIIILL